MRRIYLLKIMVSSGTAGASVAAGSAGGASGAGAGASAGAASGAGGAASGAGAAASAGGAGAPSAAAGAAPSAAGAEKRDGPGIEVVRSKSFTCYTCCFSWCSWGSFRWWGTCNLINAFVCKIIFTQNPGVVG